MASANRSLRSILLKEINLQAFPRPARPSAPWDEQIDEASFWFCALSCLLLICFQAYVSFNVRARYNLTDYGSLYASASLANLHVNPYRDHPLVFHLRDINRHGPDTPLQGTSVNAINLNPPVLLYAFRPLSRLQPVTSFVVWTYISGALFVASVLLVLRMYPAKRLRIRVLWILALGGVWYTFWLGQIYMILLFCTTLAWWALRKQKWVAAGIFIGMLCAVKPNFLVWPGLLIVGRSKKTGFTAFATTVVLSAIPLITQGPAIYRQWLLACRRFNGYELPGNASLLAFFSRAGVPASGLVLTVLMLMAVTVWIFLAKPDALYVSEIGILASLFAGPISWLGYTILLIPVLYGKSMDAWTRIGCVLLCIPLWVILPGALTPRMTYVLFWAPNLYALLLIAFSAIRSRQYVEESLPQTPSHALEDAMALTS